MQAKPQGFHPTVTSMTGGEAQHEQGSPMRVRASGRVAHVTTLYGTLDAMKCLYVGGSFMTVSLCLYSRY